MIITEQPIGQDIWMLEIFLFGRSRCVEIYAKKCKIQCVVWVQRRMRSAAKLDIRARTQITQEAFLKVLKLNFSSIFLMASTGIN